MRFSALLLLLSTLASTITAVVRCTMRGQAASTGLVRHSPARVHTACTSIAPVSTLRVTAFVATVSLFAVSGDEREKYICFITTATRALRILRILYLHCRFYQSEKRIGYFVFYLAKRVLRPASDDRTYKRAILFLNGGRRGNRTLTPLQEPDFESSASTSSAIRPTSVIISLPVVINKFLCSQDSYVIMYSWIQLAVGTIKDAPRRLKLPAKRCSLSTKTPCATLKNPKLPQQKPKSLTLRQSPFIPAASNLIPLTTFKITAKFTIRIPITILWVKLILPK